MAPHTPFPGDASGRPVTMTGTYDARGQVLVADRRLDGVAGYWVLTPWSWTPPAWPARPGSPCCAGS